MLNLERQDQGKFLIYKNMDIFENMLSSLIHLQIGLNLIQFKNIMELYSHKLGQIGY